MSPPSQQFITITIHYKTATLKPIHKLHQKMVAHYNLSLSTSTLKIYIWCLHKTDLLSQCQNRTSRFILFWVSEFFRCPSLKLPQMILRATYIENTHAYCEVRAYLCIIIIAYIIILLITPIICNQINLNDFRVTNEHFDFIVCTVCIYKIANFAPIFYIYIYIYIMIWINNNNTHPNNTFVWWIAAACSTKFNVYKYIYIPFASSFIFICSFSLIIAYNAFVY